MNQQAEEFFVCLVCGFACQQHTQTPAVLSAVLCKKPASGPLLNATELHVRLGAAENAAGLYEDHARPAG